VESNNMSEEENKQPEQTEQTEINLDDLQPDQALQFLSSAVRRLPFTYNEHVQFEQCRRSVAEAITA
tara:strand:- start:716 stop:916 length:201 start_codon:yes stop_codon:yes gene_type:complete